MSDVSLSRKLARYAHTLRYEDLPADVVACTKRFLYDSVGCAFGGYGTEDVGIVLDLIKDEKSSPDCTIMGSGEKASPRYAALANALMIRALDFNDIYWKEDPSHPSDIMPAAFSAAELTGRNGKDLLTALVLAYEVEMRLCLFATPGIRERKWHHASLTQFASPLVAGMLLGLTEDQLVNAVGINGSHNYSPGVSAAGHLTMMKNTVDPMATENGVFAAQMAQKGYRGPELVYEGKESFMDVMGPGYDENALVGGLGESFKVLECSMKAFPTEALTHTHISCALKAVTENDVQPEDIKTVTVTAIARACDILFDETKYKPETRETADHSLPYCLAAAIVDRKITTDQFSEERINDPRIQATLPKIIGEASQEFEDAFPAKQCSKVVVELHDGTKHTAEMDYPKGDPREPMSDTDLENKFKALAAPYLTDAGHDRIKDAIENIERFDNAADFMKLLVADK